MCVRAVFVLFARGGIVGIVVGVIADVWWWASGLLMADAALAPGGHHQFMQHGAFAAQMLAAGRAAALQAAQLPLKGLQALQAALHARKLCLHQLIDLRAV